jgi:Concanavalin A-like lectin/glucanases superfamily
MNATPSTPGHLRLALAVGLWLALAVAGHAGPGIVSVAPQVYGQTMTLFAGASASFALISVTGAPPALSYQWYTNGVAVPGATATNYSLLNAQSTSPTNFTCIVTNSSGAATNRWTIAVVSPPLAPYPAAVLADHPVSYWRLNETPNNGAGNNGLVANDYRGGSSSVYSNGLVAQAGYSQSLSNQFGYYPATEPALTSAKFGWYPASGATSNYVAGIPNIDFSAPTNTSGHFSIEAWANGDAQQDGVSINAAGIVAQGGWAAEQFTLDTGGTTPTNYYYRFTTRDSGNQIRTAGNRTNAPDGNWHHLVGVLDQANSNLCLYVDGVKVATTACSPSNGVVSTSVPVSIGCRMNSAGVYAQQFFGSINDVALYNYALSPEQVAAHYVAAGIPPRFSPAPPGSVAVDEHGTLSIPAAVLGTAPLSCCWSNVSAVPPTLVAGQTNATLVISNVSYSGFNNAQFQLTVTNRYGRANAAILVTVNAGAPVIVTDLPSPVQVMAGQSYTYSISAKGTEPFAYQWYLNGASVPGATSASYAAPTGTVGSYSVCAVVTNLYNGNTPGRTVSATSTLLIGPAAKSYYAAPAAAGAGDGSSPANAANYLNASFWSTVQSQLQTSNVNVNLQDGNYGAGTLTFTDMGDPLYRLTLQPVNPYGAVFNITGNNIINLVGSQNIKFYQIVVTGPAAYWGVDCQPDYLKPCRNLEFSYCRFLNLTNAFYGAIGLINGVRDVTVDNCTFTNITAGGHAHMIYASHNIVGVVVTNCVFQDCLADYVRFRDNSEYCAVQNCTFISTLSASAYPFVSAQLYNQTNGDAYGDEFFGNYFQVSSNSFTYNVSGGPGPYSALHFSDSGYTPWSYHCTLTPAEASQLSGGTTDFQRSFVQTNLGLIPSGIKMFGNTYNSRVAYRMDYTYSWDGNAPYGGWQGTVKLDNVPDTSGAPLEPTPVLRNANFDRQGLLLTPVVSSTPNECLFQTWFCNPKYTSIKWHPGFNGTTNALMFDKTASQYVYQWITPPGPAWTLDCLFTIGSVLTGSGTKFKVDVFHDDIAGSKVSVGVDNLGRFGIYNGGTFTVLPELGLVGFSVDNNGNGYYSDPGDILNVYRLRIVGNYAAATPYVNIYASDANSMTLNRQSLRRALWASGAPFSGRSAPCTVAFYNYTAPVVVDQISLVAGLADQPPVINRVWFDGSHFVFSGTNGLPGGVYYLLSSTNPALPLSSWTRAATNTFDGTGSFSITNTAPRSTPQAYYRLQLQ